MIPEKAAAKSESHRDSCTSLGMELFNKKKEIMKVQAEMRRVIPRLKIQRLLFLTWMDTESMSGDNPNTVIQKYESVTRRLLNDYAPCSLTFLPFTSNIFPNGC